MMHTPELGESFQTIRSIIAATRIVRTDQKMFKK
jgi:hypothetical protein